MSISTSNVARRRRRPQLKVISPALTNKPRHRVVLGRDPIYDIIEVITIDEWNALHPDERPTAVFMAGIGYVSLVACVSRAEADAVAEENIDQVMKWASRRGEEVIR